MKKIIRRSLQSFPALNESDIPIHPILQRIYQARGIQSSIELEVGLERLLPFHNMLGIEKAVTCLADAIIHQKNILIVGDFDADGATSTAVAIRALKSMGAKYVNYLVPNRFDFGYGLTPELIQVAKTFDPHLIMTVDNGIANHEGVNAAKKLNITVVITDHHLPSDSLPLADAIVNPNQPNDLFKSKSIAGVGVVFYVMLALRRYFKNINWFEKNNIPEPNMSHLLDLVALGTVADVVALDHNNRILVSQGLRRIRSGYCISGITALLEISGRNQKKINASDLGFAIAPRLNAAGRLDDMSLGIECLITNDVLKAREMARILDELNNERRAIEQDMQDQAITALNRFKLNNPEKFPRGVCFFDETWHQGVIGIVAGRMKDKLNRPVIAFALSCENELKGSARSISKIHIRDMLAQLATLYPSMITKFGGHAMAAGLTVAKSQYENFSLAFNEVISKHVSEDDLKHYLYSDGEIEDQDLTLATCEMIREGGPWGQSFPEPIFDGTFKLIDQRIVGNKHLKIIVAKNNQLVDGIAFNIDLNSWPNYRCEHVKIAYRLDINEFRGKRNIQLIIEHMEAV